MNAPDPNVSTATRANLLEMVCTDLQAHWAAGERIPVEGYLLRHPELSTDVDAVLELVLLEVALREEAGEIPSLTELIGRFPHLSELLRRQLALHNLLNRPAEAITREFRVADYMLVREIGRGGMGTVYEARHRRSHLRVALKMLPGTFAPGAHELKRFATEAEALTRLQHPNIVCIHEVGLYRSQPFIAFELVESGTLAERLRQGPPPPTQASVALMATLAWAVEAVHQHGIIHRDLKPANILLLPAKESDLGVPKIADFGLAKLLDSSTRLTSSGDVLGTPAYLAPEQVSGGQEVGPAADVYSLGAMLYELLTGRPPFRGASAAETLWQVANLDPLPPSRIRRGMPRDLQTICLKCLEKLPRRRYLSAAALARDLDHCLRGEPIQARPLGLLGHLWRQACRQPLVTALLVSLLLALILGLAGVTWSWQKAERLAVAESVQRRQAEASLYRSRVAQAALLWQSNNVAGALEQLDLCVPPDGKPDLRGWEWHYLRRLCNSEEFALSHRYWVQALALSPDGRELAVATGDPSGTDHPAGDGPWPGELVVWDLTGKPAPRWRRGQDEVRAVAYSPDGRWLAWGTSTGVFLLERASGQVQHTWRQPGRVSSVCFRGDSLHLACSSMTGSQSNIRVYAVNSQKEIAQRSDSGKEWWWQRLAYSPDSRWLAFQRAGRDLCLWNPRTGEEKPLGVSGELAALAFLAGGRRLASAGAAEGMVWDTDGGGRVLRLSGHSGLVCALDVAPDGRTLATAGADQTIRLWDAVTGQEKQVLRGHTWTVRGLAFRPDGCGLFSGGQDRMVKRWDITRPQRGRFLRFGDRVNAVAFAAGGRIRAIRLGGHVRTWAADDTATDSPQLDMTTEQRYPRCYADFLSGGEAVVSISRDDPRLLKIWGAGDGRERLALRGHTLPIHTVAASADGLFVASAAWESQQPARGSEIKIWDAATGALRASFTATNVLAVSLALSPDGCRLAIGERAAGSRRRETDVSVSLWEVGDGSCGAVRHVHRSMVTSVAFSPDGRCLASAGFEDGQVCLMDAADLRVLHRAPGPYSPTCLCFDPTGRRLAVIGYQGIVHLLDTEDGQEVLRLPGLVGNRDDDPASDARVCFSPDGQWLLSTNGSAAGWDTSLNVWDGRPFNAPNP